MKTTTGSKTKSKKATSTKKAPPTKKTTATATAPVAVTRKKVEELPKKYLEMWLSSRSFWNHEDWLGLLSDLENKGYSDLVQSPEGKEKIGKYLESHRH